MKLIQILRDFFELGLVVVVRGCAIQQSVLATVCAIPTRVICVVNSTLVGLENEEAATLDSTE